MEFTNDIEELVEKMKNDKRIAEPCKSIIHEYADKIIDRLHTSPGSLCANDDEEEEYESDVQKGQKLKKYLQAEEALHPGEYFDDDDE